MSRATGRPVVAYIGDSTFFHSGVTGLINAVHNEHDLLVVILDNETTAMTGHQPHPGVEQTTLGPNPVQVSIEQVVQGCGVSNVRTVKALNHKATMEALREFKELSGVRVLIAREPCVLFARRTLQKKRPQTAYVTKTTPEVWRVLKELACPAFNARGDEVVIDETQCAGCMLCVQLCDDIKARKKE
jgi:indolepyruvate ferredoxin oxidoreductase alpha subunit